MNKVFLDYYQCPTEFVKFHPVGQFSEEAGYFLLGEEILCFGRTTEGKVRSTPDKSLLYDALADCTCGRDASCILSFHPTETVNFMRTEQYTRSGQTLIGRCLASILFRKPYYLLRPLLPVVIRRYLQRCFLRGWDKIPFPHWPVDCTVDSIMERLLELVIKARDGKPMPFIWFWPEKYWACAILTHDVETKTGRDFCAHVMDIDETYGFSASFQVVPEQRYDVSKEYLAGIRDRGFEVNIHGLTHDGRLFQDRSEFLRRVKLINDYSKAFGAVGFRSPVLYRNPEWFDAFEFDYDMSIPNVGHLDPQRGGCCTVMPYFIGNILELPITTIQDYSLFHILNQYSIALWEQQIELILRKHGLISFLVHPDYIVSKKARYVYQCLLEYLSSIRSKRNIWFALPKEVDEWWRKRSRMELVEVKGKWQVKGPGKKRARVAYARLQNDRVIYEIT